VAFNFGRPVLQVCGENSLLAIDQEERSESHGSARSRSEAPNDRRQLLEPFSARLVQPVENPRLKAL
jgi:hypothetical protein